MEEAGNFKMGKYSAEERKERISKYRAKRSQRNFNKTIKVDTIVIYFKNLFFSVTKPPNFFFKKEGLLRVGF